MAKIARLKIELDEMEPPVLRRIEVAPAIRLDKPHLVIQGAMGWENYHLYAFHAGRSAAYGLPDPNWPDPDTLSVKTASLADLLGRLKHGESFQYNYDFGDDWLHTIKLEALVEADAERTYPRLIDARGRCPPEDSGGPWGYGHYLEAIADPEHEDHDEMIDWHGPDFDPHKVDEAARRKAVARLARPRRGKARAK